MRFTDFLKDKLLTISLLFFGLITIEIFLAIYPIGNFIKFYIPIILMLFYWIGISIEYFTKRKFYQNVFHTLDELEEKYLVNELIKNPNFIEGKLLKEVLE